MCILQWRCKGNVILCHVVRIACHSVLAKVLWEYPESSDHVMRRVQNLNLNRVPSSNWVRLSTIVLQESATTIRH